MCIRDSPCGKYFVQFAHASSFSRFRTSADVRSRMAAHDAGMVVEWRSRPGNGSGGELREESRHGMFTGYPHRPARRSATEGAHRDVWNVNSYKKQAEYCAGGCRAGVVD